MKPAIKKFQSLAKSALATSIYLSINTDEIALACNISSLEARLAIEHFCNNTKAEDPAIQAAVDFISTEFQKFLVICKQPSAVLAIKKHNPYSHINWLDIKETLFREKSNFSQYIMENIGYQSEFVVNFASRKKDDQFAERLTCSSEIMDKMLTRVFDGKIFNSDGTLLDTKDYVFKNTKGEAGLVITQSNDLYVFNHFAERGDKKTRQVVFHSSFASSSVFFAGSIKVKNGNITLISDYSGHYNPVFNVPFLLWLEDKGLLHHKIMWEDFQQVGVFNTFALSLLDNPKLIRAIRYNMLLKERVCTALSKVAKRTRSYTIIKRLIRPFEHHSSFQDLFQFADVLDKVISNEGYSFRHVDLLKGAFFRTINLSLMKLKQPLVKFQWPYLTLQQDISEILLYLAGQPKINTQEVLSYYAYSESILKLTLPKKRDILERRISAATVAPKATQAK